MSPETDPAWLRRWAANTKYTLEPFVGHKNHTDRRVKPSLLRQKFGWVYDTEHKPKTPKSSTSEPHKST